MVSAAESIGSAGFNDEYLAEFEPMALDTLGSSQTLTLSLSSMQSGGSSAGPGPSIAGPWEVTFQVTPQLGRSITFDQALVVHDSVAVQLLLLALAPADAPAHSYQRPRAEYAAIPVEALCNASRDGGCTPQC